MTKKFVPFEKMSKKDQKKLNTLKRRTWGALDPVTRINAPDTQKYSRKQKHRTDLRYTEY